MKVFITGGTGFIGSNLIDYLLSKNFEIFALVRNLNKIKWLEGRSLNLIQGDLFSIPFLPSDIHYVFHIAGLTKTSELAQYYTVNQQGTASLFQSLISQKIHPKLIIYVSSTAAGGPSVEGRTVREDDAPHPVSPYGQSKLSGEREALKHSGTLPVVILRPAAILGPRDTDFLQYFKFVNKGILPSLRSSKRLLSLCYVKDLVRALFLCTEKNPESGEIFNVADSRPYTYDEIGEAAGRVLGKRLRKVSLPLAPVYLYALASELAGAVSRKPSIFNRYKFREMRQESWVADTTKAEEKLCFRTEYTLQEAIRETIQWYVAANWL